SDSGIQGGGLPGSGGVGPPGGGERRRGGGRDRRDPPIPCPAKSPGGGPRDPAGRFREAGLPGLLRGPAGGGRQGGGLLPGGGQRQVQRRVRKPSLGSQGRGGEPLFGEPAG